MKQLVFILSVLTACFLSSVMAQSVCLPAPRLLTTTPMGAQVGQTLEVVLTGDNLDGATSLTFSHAGITAVPQKDDQGNEVSNTWVVSVAKDCPLGVHDAHVMTRLGMSSARAFTVGSLPEVTRTAANTTLDKAMPLQLNSICNASVSSRQVDFYSFEASKGQRLILDCAAKGIDSRLKPVLVVADANGADLQVERRGGAIDFKVPATGRYTVKVNDLTYNGGATYFYRLAIREVGMDAPVIRHPSTSPVHRASWPPAGLTEEGVTAETEPNQNGSVQSVSLPCDIRGSFFPAADVDTYEFVAKKGEVWWVEVASERLGRPTDPSVVIQHVAKENENETLTDVVELNDIPSPVRTSSNGYSYDGPPYNIGSSDVLGKLEIKADGVHRLHVRDLFGGTRSDPRNVYRLIVRKAQPDFALAGWAMHMGLRNGDRNALSKPIALRGGATMPIEVVVIRRDGFTGEINLQMSNLPDGVTATGLKIPAGKSVGTMLITADQNAPRGFTSAQFTGTSMINGTEVVRECRLASMAWPVPNAKSEIPAPRLMADIPVSVGGQEFAPLSIAAAGDEVLEVTEGESLTVPLVNVRRCEFQGATMSLRTFGDGFAGNGLFDLSLDSETNDAVLNLATLKTKPGDYTIAFYGGGVAKYQHRRHEIATAESQLAVVKQKAEAAATAADQAKKAAAAATDEAKGELERSAKDAEQQKKAADAQVKEAEEQLRAANRTAAPKDIVDIIVTRPIRIRVNAKAK